MAQARAEGGTPAALARLGVTVRDDGRWRDVVELSGYDGVPWDALTSAFPFLLEAAPRAVAQMRAEAVYGGYLHRQQAEIRGFRAGGSGVAGWCRIRCDRRIVGGNPGQAERGPAGFIRRGGSDSGDDAGGIGGAGGTPS